jgi:hypothetical protein
MRTAQADKASMATRGGGGFRTRCYGDAGVDLNVDFDAPRPFLITRLLAVTLVDGGGRAMSEDALWQWSLASRLQALLAVAVATRGHHGWLERRCGGCGETMDLELDLTLFQGLEEPDRVAVEPEPECCVTLRLPTGADQRRWLADSSGGEPVFSRMATTLVTSVNGEAPAADWVVPEGWLASLAEELEARDPLTALQLQTQCPNCGAPCAVELDLEEYLLSQLARRQAWLMDDVHRLASVYHWSEADILALPANRRRDYLSRIGEEG